MKVSINNVVITGIATALPKNKLDLESLTNKYGVNEVKRIISGTGIQSVRVGIDGMKASDLCIAATKNLLRELKIDPKTIDGIIFVSQTPDIVMPATSVMLQHRLGMTTDSVAFDINYGCSGYVYGLYQAAMLISSGGCNRVLLCAGDVITPFLHPDDHQTRMILGDAGSATLIEKGDGNIAFTLKTDGSGMQHLRIENASNNQPKLDVNLNVGGMKRPGYLYMNGAEIMAFALREVPPAINELLDLKGWKSEEVGTFALHQANSFMLNYLRKKMQLNKDVVPIAVDDVGNTGPASIPLVLSITSDQIKAKDRLDNVVMCGFGVGLSWAAAGMSLSNTIILKPVEI
jgi:3-oxoacyl-[acyl-carrier-protein] synthase-3